MYQVGETSAAGNWEADSNLGGVEGIQALDNNRRLKLRLSRIRLMSLWAYWGGFTC